MAHLPRRNWLELSRTLANILTYTSYTKWYACQVILLDYNGTLAEKDWLELSGTLANIFKFTIPKWHACNVLLLDWLKSIPDFFLAASLMVSMSILLSLEETTK